MVGRVLRFVRLPLLLLVIFAVARFTLGAKGFPYAPRGKVAWAVRKQDTALRAALDEYLGNVRRGPSWSRLLVQYFGDQALQVLGRGR